MFMHHLAITRQADLASSQISRTAFHNFTDNILLWPLSYRMAVNWSVVWGAGTWFHSELHKGNGICLLQTSLNWINIIFSIFTRCCIFTLLYVMENESEKSWNNQIVLLKILKHNISDFFQSYISLFLTLYNKILNQEGKMQMTLITIWPSYKTY
jgi:hypothetical protein